MFIDPALEDSEIDAEFLATQEDNLILPGVEKGALGSVLGWNKYANAQKRFLRAKSEALEQIVDEYKIKIDENLIWDGDGDNTNCQSHSVPSF